MATLWGHLVHPDCHSRWQITSSSLVSLANLLYLLCASLFLSRTKTKSGKDKSPSQSSQTTDQSEPASLWTSAIPQPRGESDAEQRGNTRTDRASPKAGRPCLIFHVHPPSFLMKNPFIKKTHLKGKTSVCVTPIRDGFWLFCTWKKS